MIQCSGGELLCPVSLQPAVCDNVWFGGGQEPAEHGVPASILSSGDRDDHKHKGREYWPRIQRTSVTVMKL